MTQVLAALAIVKVGQLFDLLSDKRKNSSKLKLNVDLNLYEVLTQIMKF